MTAEDASLERLPVAELRTLFLFERLDEAKLGWLAENGRVERHPAGSQVYPEGAPATCFYVLLAGTISLSRRVAGQEVEVTRTDQRGVYAGATQAYVDRIEQVYRNSLLAVTDGAFFVLPAEAFGAVMRSWFPMAMHLLEGLFFGMTTSQQIVAQRERLVALGSLTAGLTHELNNPAAAAVRATAALRERVAGMRHKLALIAEGRLDPTHLRTLVDLQEAVVERAAKAAKRSPMEVSDGEDALADWFDEQGVANGWSLAPVFVAAGLDVDWAEEIAATLPDAHDAAFRWLAYTLETEALMSEIEDATTRVSTLVAAAKQYSQMDRAPYQLTDVHAGLDSTLVMLSSKIGSGVEVVKDYDSELPPFPAYAGELNQVWTNLIDNALAAMAGHGTLTLRTRRVEDAAVVEVADTGPGIAPEHLGRVFEPFFTTKPVGEGTGLGLDISYRIVVSKHRGDLRVRSAPGDTVFSVHLPMAPAAAS